MSGIKNKVRTDDVRKSSNFYKSDLILQHYLKSQLPASAINYMKPKLEHLGEEAAQQMDELSLKADKYSPELKHRDQWGEENQKIEFHPAYQELMEIAAESEMFYLKYNDELKEKFKGSRHKMGFAAGQLYAMSELGQYCPHCMTDGAAYLVEQYATSEIKEELLPKLSARDASQLFSGAMYLTEKSGGSDVGRNLTEAVQIEDRHYELTGEKWFCSNANADVMMILARTGQLEEGTRGLSLFLVRKNLENGDRNNIEMVRLKEKMGVRSMATAEVKLKKCKGIRIGQEGEGFKIMAQMINISRIYNSIAAVAGARRAIVEAYEFLNHREIFGKKAVEHALIRQKLHELGSLHIANFLLVWRAVHALDQKEQGAEHEKSLLRIITPMAKWWSAEHAVYIVRECMELMGGNGYIEDFVMPKIFRDVNVLPIWEGSGNVIVLDILRAMQKTDGMDILLSKLQKTVNQLDSKEKKVFAETLENVTGILVRMESLSRDEIEATAKPLFKKLITLYQIGLIVDSTDETSSTWMEPARRFLISDLDDQMQIREPESLENILNIIGWNY